MKDIDPNAPQAHAAPGINRHLVAKIVLDDQRQQWLTENRSAIDAYGSKVEREGVFSDGLRRF